MAEQLRMMSVDELTKYKEYLEYELAHLPYEAPQSKRDIVPNPPAEWYNMELDRVNRWIDRRTKEMIAAQLEYKAGLFLKHNTKKSHPSFTQWFKSIFTGGQD